MLYVIRHGRTDWNVLYKLQGQIDIPLNDEGRQMAREAAEEGYIVLVDMVLTSADTAEITYTYAVGELTYYD